MSQSNSPDPGWLVIVNPNAGRRKGLVDWEEISGHLRSYDMNFTPVFTERPGHATEIVIEYVERGKFRKIIAVGGDGTMNEVVNGIFRQKQFPTTDISLGMVTVGTGNDWGRMFGIPTDYKGAIKVLAGNHTFVQDAGEVSFCNAEEPGNRYFVNIAGMGFEAEVVRKTNLAKERGKSGPFIYLIHLLTSLLYYRYVKASISVDGLQVENKIFNINVGIGKYGGGGMIPSPNAILDDGLFDLTIIRRLSKPTVILNMKRLYNGTIHKHRKVDSYTAKSIRVESSGTIQLQTDGETLGHAPIEFSIIPKSVRIFTGNLFMESIPAV